MIVWVQEIAPIFYRGTIHPMTKNLSPEEYYNSLEYYRSLPSKRMAAGALFVNQQNEILLVHPTYKPRWEIPGGVTEIDESPRTCVQREVQEEIGLDREIGRLLVVEYQPRVGVKTESLMFIFDGGILTAAQIAAIRLPAAELDGFDFFPADALPEAMSATLRRRVQRAYTERMNFTDSYFENQL